jgi:hypothetical protein
LTCVFAENLQCSPTEGAISIFLLELFMLFTTFFAHFSKKFPAPPSTKRKKNYYQISASKCEYIDFFHLFPIGEISIIFIPFDEHLNHNLIKFVESFIKRIVSLWLGRCGAFWENFLKLLENWKTARKVENC